MADKVVELVADLMNRQPKTIKATNDKPDRIDTMIKTIELCGSGLLYATPFITGGFLIANCGVWGGVLGYQFARDFLKKDVTKIFPQAQEMISKQKPSGTVDKTSAILDIAKNIQKEKQK